MAHLIIISVQFRYYRLVPRHHETSRFSIGVNSPCYCGPSHGVAIFELQSKCCEVLLEVIGDRRETLRGIRWGTMATALLTRVAHVLDVLLTLALTFPLCTTILKEQDLHD